MRKKKELSSTERLSKSGRTWIVFHLDKSMKRRVRAKAKKAGKPITQFCEDVIKRAV